MQAEVIGEFSQQNNSCARDRKGLSNEILISKHMVLSTDCSVNTAEQDCEQDEGSVPFVLVVYGTYTQEHEYDRLRAVAQHLEATFDGRE